MSQALVMLSLFTFGSVSTSLNAIENLLSTEKLTIEGDLAEKMVEGIDRFLMRELSTSIERREKLWDRNYSSKEAYEESVVKNREDFLKIIGAVDAREPIKSLEYIATTEQSAKIAQGERYAVYAVRWHVFDGVFGEGLLLEPEGKAIAQVVALPDADWTPEMLIGLDLGITPEVQFARRLAEQGCRVLIPVLIDRKDTWSGNPTIKMTNQPHREFIYRMAFEVGRHIIGYEVQKVLAAVDWFSSDNGGKALPIGVIGYGEGGLLALYSAAADTRIDAVVVSGYFQSRQEVWKEPIYRNVWGLLYEFGDAEIASLIAPRTLIIEASEGPEVDGPPEMRDGRSGAAPGRLVSPSLESVETEFKKARQFYERLGVVGNLQLVKNADGAEPPGSDDALAAFLAALGHDESLKPSESSPADFRKNFDVAERLFRQFDQLVSFTQKIVRQSEKQRKEFWSKADISSLEKWKETCQYYRDYLWDEVIGRFPPPAVPPNPKPALERSEGTRLVYDEPNWKGYEVVLDVWQDVFACGILLIPKDISPGERRPVVVCQHGLEGRPQPIVDPEAESAYNSFGAKLADRGFVVFAPQNPYIGGDKFRVLQRKANPLKKSLFSIIVRQHERILEWLAQQSFVDGERIAFYGLSYGGKTAVRVPALLENYALSICSADFNEWIVKNTTVDYRYSYMFTGEYEMPEFDLGNTFNYSELAGLIAPRPFMVERGHLDGVAPDEWVAYEYAKVRRLYAFLGIPDKTAIEFFNDGHMINGQGTFDFLHRHLSWPKKDESDTRP